MADVTREPQHGQSHPTAHDEADRAESRAETVERVLDESGQDDTERAQGSVPAEDPTTRRGFNRLLTARAAVGFLVGLVLGVAIILVANAIDSQALGEPGAAGLTAASLVTGALLGVFGAILTAFVFLEREDGRIERKVEEDVGGDQPAPAEALDPKHDVGR